MSFERLANPPLVEAIMELRWRARGAKGADSSATANLRGRPEEVDQSYDVLVGRMYDRLAEAYRFHERLPVAAVPAYMIPHVIQHRFRVADGAWPLVQLGPGIATVNDTVSYSWSEFRERALELVKTLFDIHPDRSGIVVESMLLRYINAEQFDYSSGDSLDFLRKKLKVSFEVPKKLFRRGLFENRAQSLNFQVAYPCLRPEGSAHLMVATGTRDGREAIVWQTTFTSTGDDVPALPQQGKTWLDGAHSVMHHWFTSLVEGELLEMYSGT